MRPLLPALLVAAACSAPAASSPPPASSGSSIQNPPDAAGQGASAPAASAPAASAPAASAAPAPAAAPSQAPPEGGAGQLPAHCTGARVEGRAAERCPAHHPGRRAAPGELKLTMTPSTLPPVKPGEELQVKFVVENVSSGKALLDLTIEGSVTDIIHAGGQQIDPSCTRGSGPPTTNPLLKPEPRTTRAVVELLPGGKLEWSRTIRASRRLHVVDQARLKGWQGSGTPCNQGDEPVARGRHPLVLPAYVRGLADLRVELRVQ